jgi:hypothetical protein
MPEMVTGPINLARFYNLPEHPLLLRNMLNNFLTTLP